MALKHYFRLLLRQPFLIPIHITIPLQLLSLLKRHYRRRPVPQSQELLLLALFFADFLLVFLQLLSFEPILLPPLLELPACFLVLVHFFKSLPAKVRETTLQERILREGVCR